MSSPKRQIGATAIEYALAFPVFFALLYAILMYGFIFLMRIGLQHAAEDGARAVLHFPDNIPEGSTELQVRQAHAESVASQQISWIQAQAPDVDVSICTVSAASCTGNSIDSSCTKANAYATRCQAVVTVTYPYQQNPIIPPLPGFGLLAPSELQGSARMLLDGRALSSP